MDETGNNLVQAITATAELLKARLTNLENPSDILKAVELKALYDELRSLNPADRPAFGQALNALRSELQQLINAAGEREIHRTAIDITAPFGSNLTVAERPKLLPMTEGTIHPLMQEITAILEIFYRMGFTAVESRELDDDFHMFGSLNFPEDHPARDDFDTFMTVQKDAAGKPFVAPAHTSTMQHRVLLDQKANLDSGVPIAAVIPGRVFRNEDLDARHEHTFYQLEGVYVSENVSVSQLIATLKTFLQEYYRKELDVKTQPFYFPFTEPSFEFALSCPFCDKAGCSVCSYSGWIELLGCGMIHPNVLRQAGIDSNRFSGFAWGSGIERLVMMKYGIEDVRYFESGRLDFLRQF